MSEIWHFINLFKSAIERSQKRLSNYWDPSAIAAVKFSTKDDKLGLTNKYPIAIDPINSY